MVVKDKGLYSGKLGEYQIIETEDGSTTLKSPYFNEVCHSLNGAYAETIHNYVLPSQVQEKFCLNTAETLCVLEVGFGLGVGVQATFEALEQLALNSQRPLHYIALELDEGLIQFAQDQDLIRSQSFPLFKDLNKEDNEGLLYYQACKNKHKLTVLVGDARVTLKKAHQQKLVENVDIIYQDPFSPRKNPQLWTYEWFAEMAQICRPNACLST